uniref:Glyoxylate reductase/hydroxypyruvate reductase n=1 Tax=Acrobeloides nanus TaxID=290746 RepID=A0A914EB91_9BILA
MITAIVYNENRGVKIGYCPGETTEVSAEFGVGLLLATARRIPEANEASKDPANLKVHKKSFMCGKQILGTTIGFFGLGAIGSSMLEKLAPFRPARFIYHNRSRKENCLAEYVSFDELVKESDFLIVTAPLTPETTGKFDKDVFAKMKQGAIFINISRGPLVKTEDLYDALKSGHLEAAGLDVADPEPLPKGHPMLALKNCIVTPHMATSTYRARNRMNDLTVTNIINGLTGKPMLTPLLE